MGGGEPVIGEKKERGGKKKVMFNLQAEIKGPGSAEEAGNMKGDDVIVHTQPFVIVSFFSLADGGVCFLSESTERRRDETTKRSRRGKTGRR